MDQQIGRLGKLFVKAESAYGTAATMAAANALRHLDVGFTYNLNRQNSMEKRGTPGLKDRFSRHIAAAFDLRSAYLSPSGTIGTKPEADVMLLNGMGAQVVGTLSSVVTAFVSTLASGASTTSFTLGTGNGSRFAIGQSIDVRLVANASTPEIRTISNLVGDVVTVSVALSGTPATGDTARANQTTTQFTLADTKGDDVVAGEMIAIRRAANGGIVEPRYVSSKVNDTITVSPALGAAPAVGDTVKAGVTYKLANDLPASLTLARYLSDVSYQIEGGVVDKLGFTLDGNDEVKFRASGPARIQTRPAQAEPGGFTTVGAPVTGIVGAFMFNGTARKITRLDLEIANMSELINDSLGASAAEGFYRGGRRDITLAVDHRLTEDEALYAAAEAAGDATMLCHVGNTEGRVWAVYAPKAEFDIPDIPDDDGAIRLSFKGVAKETDGNDEFVIANL